MTRDWVLYIGSLFANRTFCTHHGERVKFTKEQMNYHWPSNGVWLSEASSKDLNMVSNDEFNKLVNKNYE